jgi:hypothetical protein
MTLQNLGPASTSIEEGARKDDLLRSKIDGHPTETQLATIAAMEAAGAFTCIAEGLDRALAVLEGWGLLRGRAS